MTGAREAFPLLRMTPLEQYIKDNLDDPELDQKVELFKIGQKAKYGKAVCETVSMYTHHKCRCDKCRAAWAERMRTKYR